MDLASIGGIIASLCSFGLAIIIILYTDRKFRRYDSLVDNFSDLLRYEEDDEGNIMLDARITKIIDSLGSRIASSAKMSMLQGLSVNAKLDKGLKGAMAADMVENKMPLIGLIGDIFGVNTQKWIQKHPDAIVQLAQQFGPMFLKNNHPGGPNPSNQRYGVM